MYNLHTYTISCPYLGRLCPYLGRMCPYLGGACPYLGGACPYLGSEPYEAKLIIKNRFFPVLHYDKSLLPSRYLLDPKVSKGLNHFMFLQKMA